MLKNLIYTRQLLKIGLTFAKHDALFGLEAIGCSPTIVWFSKLISSKQKTPARKGERLARALEELGPTYIKLGQLLSTRSDLIGEEIARDLSYLRDRIPPFPTKQAIAIIEEEFECKLNDLFQNFDETPIAAASIAQVHFAVTPEGDEVAVKLLRPGIAEKFEKDVRLFHWMGELVERKAPHLHRLHPMEVVRTISESMMMELDLRYEAAAAEELHENFAGNDDFYIPQIDWNRTGGNVLTLERVRGIKISDVEAIKEAGHDVDAIVSASAKGVFKSVFQDGFFHADLHPGNLFIMEDSRIGVIDFGIMGRIDEDNQLWLAEVLWGMFREDYDEVARIHIERGIVPDHFSAQAFAQACRAIGKPIMGKPVNEISVAKLIAQLLHVAQSFEMQLQPQLLLLQKTLMLAEGVGLMLNPNINMWKTAEPFIIEWGKYHLGPKARIRRTAKQGAEIIQRLPVIMQDMQQTLEKLNSGGLQLHPDTIEVFTQSARRRGPWLRFAWAALTVLTAILVIEVMG